MPTMHEKDVEALKAELQDKRYAGLSVVQATELLNAREQTGTYSGPVASSAVIDLLLQRGRLDKMTETPASEKLLYVLRDATEIDPSAEEPAKLLEACIVEGSLTEADVEQVRVLAPQETGPSRAETLFGWLVYEENVREALGLAVKE